MHIGMGQSGQEGLAVLTDIQAFLLQEGIAAPVYDKHRKNYKRKMFVLLISNRKAGRAFLERVLPFLRVKKLLAQDVLRFYRIFPQLCEKNAGHYRTSKNGNVYRTRRRPGWNSWGT